MATEELEQHAHRTGTRPRSGSRGIRRSMTAMCTGRISQQGRSPRRRYPTRRQSIPIGCEKPWQLLGEILTLPTPRSSAAATADCLRLREQSGVSSVSHHPIQRQAPCPTGAWMPPPPRWPRKPDQAAADRADPAVPRTPPTPAGMLPFWHMARLGLDLGEACRMKPGNCDTVRHLDDRRDG